MSDNMDIYLFRRGESRSAYTYFGAHMVGKKVVFRVWAPNAQSVAVIGDFNFWNPEGYYMEKIEHDGIWEITIPNLKKYDKYKYLIETRDGRSIMKSDPYGFYTEMRPNTASLVYGLPKYKWGDKKWMNNRTQGLEKPMNIYEVHLGSWKRTEDGRWLEYREIADKLVKYLKDMNYTHVEIMPICEYPLDTSWGYQGTGYYAVTSRYGEPTDFMYFVDTMHKNGIGVILDWVPGHFCKDDHGLYRFDGTGVYEGENPIADENELWGTAKFNYKRPEVRSFLISNAMFWLDIYHIDGIRIDAVANIVYLAYGREDLGLRNKDGGLEDLDGIAFLKQLNSAIYENYPNVMMFAEDSTALPNVTKHPVDGGLGFTAKWNMGWMNDTLKYFHEDPIYRTSNHDKLTFSIMYAFSENYVLPLSHDEVVHGKCSLINKMPGFFWAQLANVRNLMMYQMTHPGKKLNFMGNEIAQGLEWRYYEQVEWNVLERKENQLMQKFAKVLNGIYLEEQSLWEDTWDTYNWIEHENAADNVIAYMRKKKDMSEHIIAIFNFSGNDKESYRIGVPNYNKYKILINSDDPRFGGTGYTRKKVLWADKIPQNGYEYSIELPLKATSSVILKCGEKIGDE